MTLSALALFGATYLLGAMSPGPNTVTIAHRALTGPRSDAMAVAAGIAAANLFWVTATLFGVAAIVLNAPIALGTLQCLGGGYLAWRGVAMLRSRDGVPPARAPAGRTGRWRAVRDGLLTNLSNPKTFLFYAAVLSSVAPPRPDARVGFALAATVVVLSFAWYGSLAWLLSGKGNAGPSVSCHRVVTRLAGLALVVLGAGIALSSVAT